VLRVYVAVESVYQQGCRSDLSQRSAGRVGAASCPLPTLPSAFYLLRQGAGMLAPLAAHHARALSPVIGFAAAGLRV